MQRAIALWGLGLAILTGIAWAVCPHGQCTVIPLDRAGLELAHTLRSTDMDGSMSIITWTGSLAVLLPLAIAVSLVLMRRGRQREAGFVILAVSGATVISHLAKLVWMRPRPELFTPWTAMPADWSYPSAHAMQIAAAATVLLLINRRHRALLAVPLVVAALLVGLSRIHLQVHFPSDVLAGLLVAPLWVIGLHAWMLDRPVGNERLPPHGIRA